MQPVGHRPRGGQDPARGCVVSGVWWCVWVGGGFGPVGAMVMVMMRAVVMMGGESLCEWEEFMFMDGVDGFGNGCLRFLSCVHLS